MSNEEGPQMELQAVEITSPSAPIEEKDEFFEFEFDGKIVNFKLLSKGNKPKDTTSPDVSLTSHKQEPPISHKRSLEIEKREKIFNLMPDSTNAWLFIKDDLKATAESEVPQEKQCCMTDNMANKLIAIIIISLQICAYILMTKYLMDNRNEEFEAREKTCYGPNCNIGQPVCMSLTTGGLMSVLLIGFLWADVVNVLSICVDRINKRNKLHWFGASFLILAELITAIVCGFLVGLYSENDFDAIGGAVGILFVHDLDEKVFASMQLFRGTSYSTIKKLIAVSLWVFLSVTVAVTVACKYEDGSFFNAKGELQCREAEYQCYSDSSCIWYGFVCNGIEDCSDGSDEGTAAGCIYQSGLNNDYCPSDKPFMCIEDGSCLDKDKQCDGIIDCPDGSDEGRAQNCTEVIAKENCELPLTISDKYANDTYHKVWTGNFKCNNGQCIDARFACDGQIGDCVDGSDEYPLFYKGDVYPGESACPYAQLVECDTAEVLCKIDGRCIAKSKVCDGEKDCSDGADEAQCEIDCQDEVLAFEKFQCGGSIATINATHIIHWFDADAANFSIELEENTEEYTPGKTDITSLFGYDLFEGVTGECIPLAWRCDGVADCDDGTDEDLCSVFNLNNECTSDQYQCTDTNACIPKSYLCDNYADCDNGEDELTSICIANGVDPDANNCVNQGYAYQCEDDTSICLYSYSLCDGYIDCPNEDDEVTENCIAALKNANGSATIGQLTCNQVTEGVTTEYSYLSFTLEFPAEYTDFKITTCLSDNEGFTELYVTGNSTGEYMYGDFDDFCSCTDGRSTIVASTDNDVYYNITAGALYDVTLYTGFTGNYAISVECGTSAYSLGNIDGEECHIISINNTSSDITECDQVLTGTLAEDESIVFAFNVGNIQAGPVTFSACASDFDTILYIYNASSIQLKESDDDCREPNGYQSFIAFDALDFASDYSDTYYLQLTGYEGAGGHYSITYGCGASNMTTTTSTFPPSISLSSSTVPPGTTSDIIGVSWCGQELTGTVDVGDISSFSFDSSIINGSLGYIYFRGCDMNINVTMIMYQEANSIPVATSIGDGPSTGIAPVFRICENNDNFIQYKHNSSYSGGYILEMSYDGGIGGNYSLETGCV